ncbi:DUF862-domain-containing protein, partial [Martensiomyces pterosporus]
PVKLYLYDLSQGMAKQLSVAMTGRYFEAIWHSSVVVYNTEYFYGQGVMTSAPGSTMHGSPVEVVDVGTTYLPKDIVTDYVEGMRQEFSADKYHLLKFNCNTFSGELVKALTGAAIPEKVSSLPDDFMETPLGRQMLPMLEAFYGQAASSISGSSGSGATSPPAAALQAPSPYSSMQPAAAAPATRKTEGIDYAQVQSVASPTDLTAKLKGHRAAVVYFTSFSCPPCRVIAPVYEEMIRDRNDAAAIRSGNTLLGIKVDCGTQYAVAAPYNIRGTPTFMFFLNGEPLAQFSGADSTRLKSEIDFLMYSAYPPHPHTRLSLAGLNEVGLNYILFKPSPQQQASSNGGSLAPIFKRIREAMPQHTDGHVAELDQLQKDVESAVQSSPGQSRKSFEVFERLSTIYEALPFESRFPVIDLVRMMVVVADPESLAEGSRGTAGRRLVGLILSDVVKSSSSSTESSTQPPPPKAALLLALRLACNLFASATTVGLAMAAAPATYMSLGNDAAVVPRTQTTELLVSTLLSADASVRRTAASLAFNIAAYAARGRQNGSQEQQDEDWLIELVSAITKGI